MCSISATSEVAPINNTVASISNTNSNSNSNSNINNNINNVNNTFTGPLMNNGSRDTTSSADIQKLQQQLQDIKEQVKNSPFVAPLIQQQKTGGDGIFFLLHVSFALGFFLFQYYWPAIFSILSLFSYSNNKLCCYFADDVSSLPGQT